MKEYKVDEEYRDRIQAIHFELDATKNLINYLWSQSPVNMEAVEYYTKQCKELYIEFEVAKTNLVNMYNIRSGENWDFDYNTCLLKVNEE